MMHPTISNAEKAAHWQKIDEVVQSLGVETLMEETRKGVYGLTTGYRIYSMSQRWNNLSMWEWYGDKHRGYCLELRNFARGKSVRDVVYRDALPAIDWMAFDRTRIEAELEVFFTKHLDWRNEEEVRMVVPRGRGPIIPLSPPEMLARIILGKDMRADSADQIRSWAQQRQPSLPVVHTRWDEGEATLMIK